jgi:hypothetical protein
VTPCIPPPPPSRDTAPSPPPSGEWVIPYHRRLQLLSEWHEAEHDTTPSPAPETL